MFRFLLGCAVTAVGFYVCANHPDWVLRAMELGKAQVVVASRNVSALASGERSSITQNREDVSPSDNTAIDFARARKLAGSMNGQSSDELWHVMDEDDYDRRAAAAQVLLGRAGIPATAEGVDAVNRRYVRSSRPESIQTGFSYLGLLALQQDVPERSVARLAQTYVERHPRDQACDNAIWALGELASDELVPYFFQIIDDDKYGPAARERAFCCLAQCGRYSQAQRLAMVPNFIRLYESNRDSQTRSWTMQALAHCAPGVRARSINEYRNWWARQ